MKELRFKKVFEKEYIKDGMVGKHTYYKLSIPIKRTPNGKWEEFKEWEYIRERCTDSEKLKVIKDEFQYILISDAVTHDERLVFPSIFFQGKYMVISDIHMDGEYTLLTQGGDKGSVYPHEYYFERIAKVNNLKYIK